MDTAHLLDRVAEGDPGAIPLLLERYRDRLQRMVSVRLDRRLAPRLDASDVVQEALAEAANKLVLYAQSRPVAFYPWLRQIAWQQLVMNYRRHVVSQRRSTTREAEHDASSLSDSSRIELANRLLSPQASPSAAMMRDEMKMRVLSALDQLSAADREVLVLHYLEQVTMREVAEVLGIAETAAHNRHTRALLRLRELLRDQGSEP